MTLMVSQVSFHPTTLNYPRKKASYNSHMMCVSMCVCAKVCAMKDKDTDQVTVNSYLIRKSETETETNRESRHGGDDSLRITI